MDLRTRHSIDLGKERLLNAPRDVVSVPTCPEQETQRQFADREFQQMFQSYLKDMADVYEIASETWEADLDELIEYGSTEEQAIETKLGICAAGPAENLSLTWLIRKYWLECDMRNRHCDKSRRVRPETLLLSWLEPGRHDDFIRLLTCMPYWPIGLDENGNWC